MGRRIAVVGTGANGASIAADLVNAGHDVTLIEQWPAHVETMRADGLRVEMPMRTLEVSVRVEHLCQVASLRNTFDVVFCVVKAYDTRWACELIRPVLAPDGVVVGVQNGMTAVAIAEVVGAERTLGAVIECSSSMFEPGVVDRHTPPAASWFAVGALDPRFRGHEQPVAELLRASGTVEVVQDILSAKWMKLVSNCTTLVTSAILGLPMRAALTTPGMREVMVRCGEEALQTGRELGHQVLPIFGLDAADVVSHDGLVERLLDVLYEGFVLPQTTTTVLQDWRKGRHSEVDELNGQVVRERARRGTRAPANETVQQIAHRIEIGELAPAVENLALLREMPTPG